jgi:hypothetical protein
VSHVLHARATHNALLRYRSPDDPVVQASARDLRAARLEDFIRKTVAAAPPLTPEQRDRLALLLRGAAAIGGEAA